MEALTSCCPLIFRSWVSLFFHFTEQFFWLAFLGWYCCFEWFLAWSFWSVCSRLWGDTFCWRDYSDSSRAHRSSYFWFHSQLSWDLRQIWFLINLLVSEHWSLNCALVRSSDSLVSVLWSMDLIWLHTTACFLCSSCSSIREVPLFLLSFSQPLLHPICPSSP